MNTLDRKMISFTLIAEQENLKGQINDRNIYKNDFLHAMIAKEEILRGRYMNRLDRKMIS